MKNKEKVLIKQWTIKEVDPIDKYRNKRYHVLSFLRE